jgi:rare lipoprotein A
MAQPLTVEAPCAPATAGRRASRVKTAKSFFRVLLTTALLCFLLSCAGPGKKPQPPAGYPEPYKIGGHWYQPLKDTHHFSERGLASWYGKGFHGHRTASGEVYNMYEMTAAHKTLPMGTYVRVRNFDNGKTVDVRINDRGPFVRGRILDLSYEAAKRIGVVGPGTAPVEIIALGFMQETKVGERVQRTMVPMDYHAGDFTIQVGAFRDRQNAVRVRDKLARTYQNAHIVVYESGQGTFHRVRVGRSDKLEQAREYERILEAAGYPDAMVVAR